MKKTNYKCLRFGGITVVCLLLIALCFVPLTAFAEEQDSVHFINPTAITVANDCLYVADVVEDNKTALLCFKADGNSSVSLQSTCEIDGVVTDLSNDGQNTIYAILGKSVAEITVENGVATPNGKVYDGFEKEVTGFVKGQHNGNDTLFALTNDLLRRNNATGEFGKATNNNWTETKGCLSLNGIVFYVYKSVNGYLCSGYNSDGFILSNSLSLTEPLGIIEYCGKTAFFSKHSITHVNDISMDYWTSNQPFQGNALETLVSDTGDKTIADVAIKNNGSDDATLFVLNEGINKIDIYTKQNNAYTVTDTIGSDVVDKTPPTTYTSFTLVRPNGYPANIVYKTNAESSVKEIITDAKEYVILGYDGDENSHYYYVLAGDKFGWVKKSDNANSPADDGKLTIVKNNPSGIDGFVGETKFVSLNAVYVYKLPLESSSRETVNQSANAMKSVTVLQEYKEGDTIWYYVSYDEGKTGFVKKSDVGEIRITTQTPPTKVEGLRKINSSLFSAVSAYNTKEMSEDDFATDSDEKPIKLYSGDRVTLIKIEGNSAFVMIQHDSDNSKNCYGWIDAGRLIGVHDITTNAIVGLSLLAVAIALTAVLLIIYFKRKKKVRANKD